MQWKTRKGSTRPLQRCPRMPDSLLANAVTCRWPLHWPLPKSAMVSHVDLLHRHPRSGSEQLIEVAGHPGEGEHGAVVLRVGVAVEQSPTGVQRSTDRGDRRRVAALGEVGDGEQGLPIAHRSLAILVHGAKASPRPDGAAWLC